MGPRAASGTLSFGSTICDKFILIALDLLAVDKVGDVQQHLSALSQSATHFFVERKEGAVHLECHCARTGLTLPLPAGGFTQLTQVFTANCRQGVMPVQIASAIFHVNFDVHFGLAMQLFNVAHKLPLI